MKKNKQLAIVISQLIALFLIPTIIFVILLIKIKQPNFPLILSIIYVLWLIVLSTICILSIKRYIKYNLIANETVNYYIEREVSKYGMGAIAFLDDGTIIWISNFIENRFSRSIIGKNIKTFFNITNWTGENLDFDFEKNNLNYEVHISLERNLVVMKDATISNRLMKDYKNQRIVFGELNIDNINLLQSTMTEDELFKVYSLVLGVLENLAKKYDLIYRQYENGKYFLLTTQETLDLFEKLQFKFFEDLDPKKTIPDNVLTLSTGFAYGILKYDDLSLLAKEALLQSQTRGGNQTTIITKEQASRHYGSVSEIKVNISRTSVNLIAQNLINKLSSKEISKVIVYGHQNADLDAIGSAYAIYTLAKIFNKEAYIQNINFDDTGHRQVEKVFGMQKNLIFINPRVATSFNGLETLVVLVDIADENRIENKQAFKDINKNNVIVIDHHRVAKQPQFALQHYTYIDSQASSASEIITEIIALSNLKSKITPLVAQLLLDGIYLDTSIFQKHTSSKTFYACSLLEEWGASAEKSIVSLKMSEDIYNKVKLLNSNIYEIKPGYFLAYRDIEVSNDIIAIAADEILRVEGRKAAFVVAKLQGTNRYKLSARGINTNVQIIAEAVNGGGHFGSAAAESTEPLAVFVDNIKQAIVSVKNESNNN